MNHSYETTGGAMYIPLDSTHPAKSNEWYETNLTGTVKKPTGAQLKEVAKLEEAFVKFAKQIGGQIPNGFYFGRVMSGLKSAVIDATAGIVNPLNLPSNA